MFDETAPVHCEQVTNGAVHILEIVAVWRNILAVVHHLLAAHPRPLQVTSHIMRRTTPPTDLVTDNVTKRATEA